jgi:uncharacterized Zn finger protein (UPF0148 family)
MSKDTSSEQPRHCPSCGEPLVAAEGDLLRCARHGAFFRYGPRLLVRVSQPEPEAAVLMPWQTLRERVVG